MFDCAPWRVVVIFPLQPLRQRLHDLADGGRHRVAGGLPRLCVLADDRRDDVLNQPGKAVAFFGIADGIAEQRQLLIELGVFAVMRDGKAQQRLLRSGQIGVQAFLFLQLVKRSSAAAGLIKQRIRHSPGSFITRDPRLQNRVSQMERIRHRRISVRSTRKRRRRAQSSATPDKRREPDRRGPVPLVFPSFLPGFIDQGVNDL